MQFKPLLFSLTLMLAGLHLSATTFHTISIDGTNDFAADETFSGTSGSMWYFTWDANNFYFAVDASDVNANSTDRWVHLYIDTDPNSNITAGSGSSTGVTYNTQTPGLPFSANYHFRWRTDNTYTNMLDYNDGTGSWTDDNTSGGNFGIAAFQSGTYVEFSIPRASLGSPDNIHVAGAMINEQGGNEFTFFMLPDNNSEGYDADYANFYGFPLQAGISPNDAANLNNNLPVELSAFSAKAERNRVNLHWQTAQEINNDYFTVQRKSSEERAWTDLAKIAGHGNSNTEIDYIYTDKNPQRGINYYRLKQTDFDGQFSYTHTVKAQINTVEPLEVFPNPTADVMTVNPPADFSGGSLQVFDSAGRLVQSRTVNGAETVSLHDLTTGIYLLRLTDARGNLAAESKVRKL